MLFRYEVRNLLAPWNKIGDFGAKRIPKGFNYSRMINGIFHCVQDDKDTYEQQKNEITKIQKTIFNFHFSIKQKCST